MARPIKMHEDTLFRVMQKSLKPLEASMSKVSIALQTQSVESKIEGKRAEKITQDNEIKQTNLLNDIATSFKYERKILQAGFKGMKSIAAMPMKVGGFIKDHWGKLGLVGIGTALATMDAKDWMNLINSLRDGLKTVKEKWPDWQKNIQSKEWWGKQADKLKTFGEKMGGYIMDGIKIWLTGKAVLSLGAAFAKYLAPAIVTAMVSKKVLKDAIKNSGLVPSKTGDAATKKPVDTKKPPATGTFKEKVKNAAARTKEIAKKGAGRWMPILSRAGALLGWVAAPLLVVPSIAESLDESVKKLKEQKEAPKVWDWNNNFFTVLMDSSTRLAETLSLGALEKSKMDKAAKDTTEKLSKSIIRIFSKVNFHFNRTTEQMEHDWNKWKTKKKEEFNAWMKKPGLMSGVAGPSEASQGIGLTRSERIEKFKNKGRTPVKQSNPEAEAAAARQKARAGDTGEPSMMDKGLSWFRDKFLSKKPAKTGHRITGAETPTFSSKPIGQVGKSTNMSGVLWNQLSPFGRKGIETSIWSIYDQYGLTPHFTSGLRAKGHPLYNPNSKHTSGMAFDLRSIGLGNKKELISAQLRSLFSGNGWGFQDEIAGQRNSTGTIATADHFHIHKAARGYHGMIKQPTGFIVGEAGEERVDITPMNSPNSRMAKMNSMYNERAMSTGSGSSPINLITSSNSTSSSNNTVPVFTPQVRGKQYV